MIIKNRNIRNIMMKRKMFEMAFDKAKYQDKVTDRMQRIAQNWCLCMYCHLYKPNFITYKHWKYELYELLDYLNNLIIKNKNNKMKYTYEALTKIAEYDNGNNVFKACRNKFRIERELNIPLEKQIEICDIFSDSIIEISECIGGDSSVLEYINNKFPEIEI